MAIRRQTGAVSGAPSTLVSDSDSETADAARGAATSRFSWRDSRTDKTRRSTSDCPGDTHPRSSVSTIQAITCTSVAIWKRTAPCAVRDPTLAVRAVDGGVSDPPGLSPVSPRGRPGGSLTPRCWCRDFSRVASKICAAFARPLSRAYAPPIARGSHRTFDRHSATSTRAASAITSRERGAVLGLVQALRSAPTRCAGLRAWTRPARSSKVALI